MDRNDGSRPTDTAPHIPNRVRPPYADGLLMDANVLIEYAHADEEILALVARHLGPTRVLSTTLSEVDEFETEDCRRLGIPIIEPTPAQRNEADGISSRTSRNDKLCFVACRQNGWTLATNDRLLRRLCERDEVPVRYALELAPDLFGAGQMSRPRAESVAEKFHYRSPNHYPQVILDWFRSELDERDCRDPEFRSERGKEPSYP